MILEACVSSKEGLISAEKFNIQRVEICENLELDGLTPSLQLQNIGRLESVSYTHLTLPTKA